MSRKLAVFLAVAAGVLPAAAGCSSSAAVSGSVTYEGQPVARGAITFLPEDGRGPSCGGPIVDGRYRVEGATPGKKIVQIVGVKAVRFAQSSEEMERAAKEAAAKGDTSGIIERTDVIDAGAEGNNGVVDLAAGEQTLDFPLQRSAKSPGGAGGS